MGEEQYCYRCQTDLHGTGIDTSAGRCCWTCRVVYHAECRVCGIIAPIENMVSRGVSAEVCRECAESHRQCDDCGKWVPADQVVEYGHYVYCPDCAASHEVSCYNCGALVYDEDTQDDYAGNDICRNCAETYYAECSDCGRLCHENDATRTRDDGDVCPRCVDRNYTQCDRCGEWVQYLDDDGRCDDCSGRNTDVHDYNYKPPLVIHRIPSDRQTTRLAPLYGVECELSGNPDYARAFLDRFSPNERLYYLKYDGSIRPEGFEIVSHAGTLTAHRDQFPWHDALTWLYDRGFRANSSTGIHIHISRSALTPSEIRKVNAFVSTQRDRMEALAGRQSNDYAAYITIPQRKRCGRLSDSFARNVADRYEAVNLANRKTVELRIFHGTTDAEILYAYLELADAIVRWARTVSIAMIITEPRTSWESFWMFAQSCRYAYLIPHVHQHIEILKGENVCAL